MLPEESPLCDPALYDRPLCLLSAARHIFSTARGRVGKEEESEKRENTEPKE